MPTGVSSPMRVPGKVEADSKAAEQRSRSNSEETALILTSMSQGKFGALRVVANQSSVEGVEDEGRSHSDMDEDLSGDEHDENMDTEPLHYSTFRGQHYQDLSVGAVAHYDTAMSGKLNSDDAGLNHRFRHESNRVKSLVTKHITIDELRAHFDRPIIDVAKDFGICITLMKKICRRNGIKRWPHRQIRSLSKSIASMEAAMLSAQGPERDKYRDQIISLKLKRDAVIADPNKEGSMNRPKTPTKEPSMHPEEHAAFLEGIRLYGKDWRRVAQVVSTRSAVQTRTHAQKYLLKFAGRFPFETEGNKDSTSVSSNREAPDGLKEDEAPVGSVEPAKKSSVEAMAMLLNSPASTSASPPMNPDPSADAVSPRGPVSLQMLSSVQTMMIGTNQSPSLAPLETMSRAASIAP
ncbi:hypothetical protein P43SY_007946 [Pythium insidiosum]|uniref:Myb-like DNA-binding protein n=1 Tax=Pythium insidiosum TaxID=114742 RepID=A0AAD5LDV6_PYTIN|nr:hypothetical protein P43SY_007946 [Pythium insidiosum]